eukprot:1700509-Pleurochrysis_carterae.AAC.1
MLPANCAMWATIVENPVSSKAVAGVGARAAKGAATFPTAGTVVSAGVCALSSAAGRVVRRVPPQWTAEESWVQRSSSSWIARAWREP